MPSSRRDLLKRAAATSALPFIPSAFSQTATNQSPPSPNVPASSRDKFNADGSVRPFAGNTVISHLPAQCSLRDRIADLRDALDRTSYRSTFALLPVDSYHMTVFGGLNDQQRQAPLWPADLPANTPIEECTRILDARFATFRLDCPLPIRMKLDRADTIANSNGVSLHLLPADEAENRAIRHLRDRLSSVFGFRDPGHDTYVFHITVAYRLAMLPPGQDRDYRTLLDAHAARIVDAAPIIELGLPAFCSFRDMYRFEPLRYLRTS
jgi:hypothetical protein